MINWINENSGFVGVLIFIATILMGWVSGIFKSLVRKPKLKIEKIEGPTFASTFNTGKKHNGYDTHRTGIALYLNITNVGSKATSIKKVSIAYHRHITKFNKLWIKDRPFWFWIENTTVALRDFQTKIGGNMKIYPFLLQASTILPTTKSTYLQEGENTTGMVYFEQEESYGNCFPYHKNDKTKIRIKVLDSYGKKYMQEFLIPVVTLEKAKEYNPAFGDTYNTACASGEFKR